MQMLWRKQWRRRASLFIALALAACEAPSTPTESQIELTPGPEFAGSGDTLDLLPHTGIERSRSGGWYLVKTVASARGLFAIYDSTGKPEAVFLPTGRGPGEVANPFHVAGAGFAPGDSILIGDGFGMKARISVFSPPPSPRFVRSFEGPSGFSVTDFGLLVLPMVVNARYFPELADTGDARMVATPPRSVDWAGRELASFGKPKLTTDDRDVFGAMLPIDAAHVWVATRRKYEISLVGPAGTATRRIARDVPWFPVDTAKPGLPWLKRPPTRIVDLAADGDVLWVLISRAHRDWETRRPRDVPAPKPGMPLQMMFPYSAGVLFEGVIEAFDAQSGTFLGSRELTGDMRRFDRSGHLIETREDSTGTVTLKLWKPSLTRR
jgi:hypothetical protein